jgi:acyl-coenzyme A synthetase/AMP-(fatty) acid ligase
VPRPFTGEEVVALVVARGEAQHEALAQHCRKGLPPARWPERVFYAQALPKTPAGKLDRNQVKNLILNEIARQSASAQ